MFLAKAIHCAFIILQIACIKANFSGESLLICGWNNSYRLRVSVKTQEVLNKIRIEALVCNCIRDGLSDPDEM